MNVFQFFLITTQRLRNELKALFVIFVILPYLSHPSDIMNSLLLVYNDHRGMTKHIIQNHWGISIFRVLHSRQYFVEIQQIMTPCLFAMDVYWEMSLMFFTVVMTTLYSSKLETPKLCHCMYSCITLLSQNIWNQNKMTIIRNWTTHSKSKAKALFWANHSD